MTISVTLVTQFHKFQFLVKNKKVMASVADFIDKQILLVRNKS